MGGRAVSTLVIIVCAIGGVALSIALVAVYGLVLFRFDDCEPDGEYARSRGRIPWAELERWRGDLEHRRER